MRALTDEVLHESLVSGINIDGLVDNLYEMRINYTRIVYSARCETFVR